MDLIHTYIDVLTAVGLLSLPCYLVYWVVYHVHFGAWRRLWGALAAVVAWVMASTAFLLIPMTGCMGGGCAEKLSPFLEFSVLYACSSAAIVLLLHLFRLKDVDYL